MAVTIRPGQLKDVLRFQIGNRESTLVVGPPGVGKTDIIMQVADELNADVLISHPVVSDPTDFKGLPWPDSRKERAQFLPFGELSEALAVKRLTLWVLDDLGQAPAAVQAACMQLLWGGRINGHKLSKKVVFVAATNRRTDKAGVQGILEPVKSRFGTIVELLPSLDDWISWALKRKNIAPEVMAFLRFRPELLMAFKPTADIVNSPCPRTWELVGRKVAKGLPGNILFPIIAGCVGEGAAGEFMAFYKTSKELPSAESVFLHPSKAPIPEEPSIMFALVMALVHRATDKVAQGLFKYAMRLANEGKGEFAMLLVKDAVDKHPSLTNTRAFSKMILKSKFGKILGVAE